MSEHWLEPDVAFTRVLVDAGERDLVAGWVVTELQQVMVNTYELANDPAASPSERRHWRNVRDRLSYVAAELLASDKEPPAA